METSCKQKIKRKNGYLQNINTLPTTTENFTMCQILREKEWSTLKKGKKSVHCITNDHLQAAIHGSQLLWQGSHEDSRNFVFGILMVMIFIANCYEICIRRWGKKIGNDIQCQYTEKSTKDIRTKNNKVMIRVNLRWPF